MSEIYSVSLDHLLKEEKSMNRTYREFLEESTNTVKAEKNLGLIVLFSAYFVIWAAAMIVFWQTKGPLTEELGVIFRWILLPLLLFVSTVIVAKNDYFGKGNWLCVPAAAITFLTVPYTVLAEEMDTVTFTFIFPNFMYMAAGIIISVCGIATGTFWRKKHK